MEPLDKLEQRLMLIELLTDNGSLTLEEVGDRIGVSVRTVYRLIESLRGCGFNIVNRKTVYSIELDSPFIQRITRKVRFNSSELIAMTKLLESADQRSPQIQSLKLKFRNVYGQQFMDDIQVNRQESQNVGALVMAMKKKRMVVLHDYYSPHSKTTQDRLVEPYRFLLGNMEVRCYELSSCMCKNYKVSRVMGGVEVLERKWEFMTKHGDFYTDMFGFSGEKQYRVTLRLGYLASRILREDYGVDQSELYAEDGEHSLFTTKVCSFQGIGRFVLGLANDVEVLGCEDFRAYLNGILHSLTKRGF